MIMISWKFLKKCANGKMGIYGRSWRDVTQDPRFKVGRGDTVNVWIITCAPQEDVRRIRKQLRR